MDRITDAEIDARVKKYGYRRLRSLAPQTPGQSKILGLDGNTFGVNGSQVGVFEQRNEVSLCGFLESHDSG